MTTKAFIAKSIGKTISKFSPNGKYLAFVNESCLIVQSMKTNSKDYEFRCNDRIGDFDWSPDSEFVSCVIFSRSAVQVFSLEHPDWRCKIDLGSDGLDSAYWGPDSRHILTIVDLHLWISVWSLSNRRMKIIEKVKRCNPSLSFTLDGQYLALVETSDLKEYVLIVKCSSWSVYQRLDLCLSDIAGFSWNIDSTELCVWDGPCGCNLAVVNLDGENVAKIKLRSNVVNVEWGNELVCAACIDNSVLVINCLTWNVMTRLLHICELADTIHLTAYKEVEHVKDSVMQALASLNLKPETVTNKLLNGNASSKTLEYQVMKIRPILLPYIDRQKLSDPLHGCGISQMAMCYDTRLLATHSFHSPEVLWVWDLHKFSLSSVLLHQSEIRNFQWEPRGFRLLISTASQTSPHFFVWSPKEASAVAMHSLGSESLIHSQWHPYKDIIIVSSRNKILVYEPNK